MTMSHWRFAVDTMSTRACGQRNGGKHWKRLNLLELSSHIFIDIRVFISCKVDLYRITASKKRAKSFQWQCQPTPWRRKYIGTQKNNTKEKFISFLQAFGNERAAISTSSDNKKTAKKKSVTRSHKWQTEKDKRQLERKTEREGALNLSNRSLCNMLHLICR